MSRLGINTGNNPNDGQGDPLRIAMGKINSNFQELYNTLGNGFDLSSYVTTAGISTLARNLTGNPIINVSGVLNTGITTTEHIEVRNITSTGVVTATQFIGDGSQLTNVTALVGGLEVLDDNVRKGVARELNFGANIESSGPDGVGRVTISVQSPISVVAISTNATYAGYASTAGIATYAQSSGVSTYASTAGVATFAQTTGSVSYASSAGIATFAQTTGNVAYATSSGIATVSQLSQGLTGTPNISVNQVGVASYLTVTGVSTFYNNVHFDYDKYVLIGANDELQLFHNGSNSYIDNSSTNNLIIRTTGGSIVLSKYGPENMGVFNSDGSVELYYNNTKKFETTSNGVNITGDISVTGALSIGGTSVVLNAAQLQVKDKDIVVGYTTDINGNDVSTDVTANHGGISVASTVGTPIITIPTQSGINSNPPTYKQFMWVKEGNYTGFSTDSWLSNYAISIGNTTSVQLGSRLTVGLGFTVYDTYLDATDIRSRNIITSGIITAQSFSGTATTATTAGYATTSGISTVAGYATTSGISTTSQGLTGTPNISVGVITATDHRILSVAEKTTVVNGNTISLVYNTGGGNIAICTNPSGDIALNITGIPTDTTFNNYSLTFSVIVSNTGTARSCTTVSLNGVSTTIKWFGGSLAAAISGVTTTTGYDIYNFTGINTVGSASTAANYIVFGSVNGGYR